MASTKCDKAGKRCDEVAAGFFFVYRSSLDLQTLQWHQELEPAGEGMSGLAEV